MTTPARNLTDIANAAGQAVRSALATLEDRTTPPNRYRAAMETIGRGLGERFVLREGVRRRTVCVTMTVEDADYLGKGLLEPLERAGADVRIVCLWNERHAAFDVDSLDIAPIVQEYRDELPTEVDYLIVLKSIISGACVVKTNLQHMLEDIDAKEIHVVAPVMLKGAEARLSKEFPAHVASRFQYWALAIDEQKDADGNVVPGIGGEVYSRLGFSGASGKNAFVPEVVTTRMEKRAGGS